MKLKMFMDAMQAIENDRKLTKEIVVAANVHLFHFSRHCFTLAYLRLYFATAATRCRKRFSTYYRRWKIYYSK